MGSEHGGSHSIYMAHKILKLREQGGLAHEEEKLSDIFKGKTIFVNGMTDPPREDIGRLVRLHGGEYNFYQLSSTSHFVCDHLAASKVIALQAMKGYSRMNYVTSKWVTDSIKHGRPMAEYDYCIPGLQNRFGSDIRQSMFKGEGGEGGEGREKGEKEKRGEEREVGAECISVSIKSTSSLSSSTSGNIKRPKQRREEKGGRRREERGEKRENRRSMVGSPIAVRTPYIPYNHTLPPSTVIGGEGVINSGERGESVGEKEERERGNLIGEERGEKRELIGEKERTSLNRFNTVNKEWSMYGKGRSVSTPFSSLTLSLDLLVSLSHPFSLSHSLCLSFSPSPSLSLP